MQQAQQHARKFGLIKSGLFQYEICDLLAALEYKDFSRALEKLENLIPIAKQNKKIQNTFQLYLIKSEIYINTNRFQEALILLNDLHKKSESFGNYFKAKLLYLSSLAKLGILQQAKVKETQKENINKKQLNLNNKNADSVQTILDSDSFEIKSELKIALKLFLGELRLPEAKQCLYLLARFQQKQKSRKFASLYLKVNKIGNFCQSNLERLSRGKQTATTFFKFIFRIKNLLQKVKDLIK